MTQLDELLREHSETIPLADTVELRSLDRAKRALQSAAAAEPARTSRRRPIRHLRQIGLVAALAVIIASVVALLPGSTGDDAGHLGPATASAQSVLEQAARAISRQAWNPLGPGQYLYFRQVGSYGHNGPAPKRPTEVQKTWIGANGFARIVQPSPSGVIAGGDVLMFHASAQQLQAERRRQSHGAHLRILKYSQKYEVPNLDYQQVIHLPTDPSQLARYIVDHSTGGGPRFSDIFSEAQSLLMGMPLPPKISAAMYRVIARLPGMRLIGPTRDPLGRPGVAVGLFFKNQPGRVEMIFNPTTGAFLAQRDTSLNTKAEDARRGTVTDWIAVEHQAVVKSDHQTP